MNITFRQGSETLSLKVIDKAEIKLLRLSRYITERNYEAQMYVDIERESASQNSESGWRTSLNLDLGGERLHASALGSSPEKTIDLAIKEMKREVQQSHAKQATVRRRGASILKQLRQSVA